VLGVGVERIVSLYWAIIYEDDGPNGACGQSCSTTNPWRRLYVCESEGKMRETIRRIEDDTERKNSRVTGVFHPAPFGDNEINFIGDG